MLTPEKGKRSHSRVPMGTDLALAQLPPPPTSAGPGFSHKTSQRPGHPGPAHLASRLSPGDGGALAVIPTKVRGQEPCAQSQEGESQGLPCSHAYGHSPRFRLLVSLGKGSPPFLVPSTSLLGLLSQFSTVIQFCPQTANCPKGPALLPTPDPRTLLPLLGALVPGSLRPSFLILKTLKF